MTERFYSSLISRRLWQIRRHNYIVWSLSWVLIVYNVLYSYMVHITRSRDLNSIRSSDRNLIYQWKNSYFSLHIFHCFFPCCLQCELYKIPLFPQYASQETLLWHMTITSFKSLIVFLWLSVKFSRENQWQICCNIISTLEDPANVWYYFI